MFNQILYLFLELHLGQRRTVYIEMLFLFIVFFQSKQRFKYKSFQSFPVHNRENNIKQQQQKINTAGRDRKNRTSITQNRWKACNSHDLHPSRIIMPWTGGFLQSFYADFFHQNNFYTWQYTISIVFISIRTRKLWPEMYKGLIV